MGRLPLQGIRVTDFTQLVAGPYDTQLLAMMGAEVIKIESQRRPDSTRRAATGADGVPGLNRSGGFNAVNYAKKSCTLDLTKPKGVELAKQIIKLSDVVAENYGAQTMVGFGLDYPVLKELKPDIIMLSNSVVGRKGPKGHYMGYYSGADAYSGTASLTGYADGLPRFIGSAFSDWRAATNGAFAILVALYHRSKTGEGQYIDMSMTEVALSFIPQAILDYTMNGRVRQPKANRDDVMAPHGCYRCRGEDKWVAIAISSDEEWEALCKVMGRPKLAQEERFADGYGRWANQDELDRLIETWTKDYTHYEVMEILQRAGVAAGPVVNAEELVNDRHLRQRGFFVEIDHSEVGKRLLPGAPMKLSANPNLNYQRTPCIGEDNDYVFGELLHLSREEITRLVEEEVIY